MAESHSHRTSTDLEGGETSPLLASESQRDEGGQAGASGWKEYPSQLWTRSRSYLESWQHARSERGKQRQVDGDRQEPETLNIPTLQPQKSSRLQNLKTYHPNLYLALIVLSSLTLVVFFLLLVALAHLFLITLRSPNEELQERIMARSFSLDGPDEVQVLSLNEDGLSVSVQGRIGIDGDSALDEWLGERHTKGWYNRKERDVIDWAVGKVKGVQVDVGQIALRSPDWSVHRKVDELHLLPDGKRGKDETSVFKGDKVPSLPPVDLVTFHVDPLFVPLPPIGASQTLKGGRHAPDATTPLNLTLLLKPSGPDLMAFAQNALAAKRAVLDVNVESVQVHGLNAKEWTQQSISTFRRWSVPGYVEVNVGDTWKRLGQKIPKLDGNDTGMGDDFLNLTRYDFFEIGREAVSSMAQRALGIKAYAEAKNPLGKLLKGHVEYSLPFGVFLPLEKANKTTSMGKEADDVVLLAAVATEPFDIDGEDKVKLQLQGRVVPPPQSPSLAKRDGQMVFRQSKKEESKGDAAADALSGFLSRFLRGEPNTVFVHGGSPFTEPAASALEQKEEAPLPGGGSKLPAWLDRLLRTLSLPISFPGSKVTDLIQNVTINDLKITPHPFEEEKLLCSGTVKGVMNLPGQLATVDVEITDLWPDILVYNGKPPSMRKGKDRLHKREGDGGDDDEPVPEPLPDPLPEHAFGRVTPHSWAPAKTYIDPEDPKGERKLLYSELKDVPFTVLPGRGAEFRSFSWKIVTGEGARAGIEGKAKAKIWNSGLGKLVLSNLPVKGVFTVGKRGDDGDGDGDDGLTSRL